MISVVIPTHNRSDLISRAIKSVQTQTYTDTEIIVVSDGSTDDTKTVVEELGKTDERIRFLEYHPARGGNVARNTGIEAASGEYIAFLDDDDEWYSNKLEAQMHVMESSDKIGLVYTGVHIIYVNEKVEYSFKAKEKGDLSRKILLDNCIGTTSTVMVRKRLFEKTGVFDVELKALQDYDLWIRFCQVCEIGVIPEEKINYYNYTGKKQVSAITQKYIDAFLYINKKYERILTKLSNDEKKSKQYNEYMLLANKSMRNSDKKMCRKYAGKAMQTEFHKSAIAYWLLSFTSFRFVLKMRSFV